MNEIFRNFSFAHILLILGILGGGILIFFLIYKAMKFFIPFRKLSETDPILPALLFLGGWLFQNFIVFIIFKIVHGLDSVLLVFAANLVQGLFGLLAIVILFAFLFGRKFRQFGVGLLVLAGVSTGLHFVDLKLAPKKLRVAVSNLSYAVQDMIPPIPKKPKFSAPFPSSALTTNKFQLIANMDNEIDWTPYKQSFEEQEKARKFLIQYLSPPKASEEYTRDLAQAMHGLAQLSISPQTGEISPETFSFLKLQNEFEKKIFMEATKDFDVNAPTEYIGDINQFSKLEAKKIVRKIFFTHLEPFFSPDIPLLILEWTDIFPGGAVQSIAAFFDLHPSEFLKKYGNESFGLLLSQRKNPNKWLDSAKKCQEKIQAVLSNGKLSKEDTEEAQKTLKILSEFMK